ncbi:hypothetical protein Tco_0834565 [Tanacetum coccineum]
MDANVLCHKKLTVSQRQTSPFSLRASQGKADNTKDDVARRGNGYSQKDKNKAKNKTEHGIGKSEENRSQRRMHLSGPTQPKLMGQDNGENIMKSINEGPFQMGTLVEALAEETEGALQQGIPKDIYTLINHYTDAKDIWDNVKMILEGSELTKDDRESQLYDEFEHFRQIKGETIHVYYVRFTKLINDMRNIKMTMPKMQLNSKFVNNMLPEWSRFITEVK